jgi:prepilin-type N-terminal cleavage/methylation domain-containing protein
MSNKRRLPKNPGYTLIELLVVVTIASLLFGFAYASYRSFAQRQALLGKARTLEADIRKAENYASSAVLPGDCSSLDGYRLKFDTGNVSYSVHPVCGGVEKSAVFSNSFDSAVYTMQTTGGSSVLFKTLGQGTDIIGDGDSMTVKISQTSISQSVSVEILKSGEVKIIR